MISKKVCETPAGEPAEKTTAKKTTPRGRMATRLVSTLVAGVAVVSSALPAAASPKLPVLPETSGTAESPSAQRVQFPSDELPGLDHHIAGTSSPIIPRPLLEPAERALGTVTGSPMGLDAFAEGECTPLTVLMVPGTMDTNRVRSPEHPIGTFLGEMGSTFQDRFGDNARVAWIPYTSDAVATASYGQSRIDGAAAVEQSIDYFATACPSTSFAFVGYSQGADIVNVVASNIVAGQSRIEASQVNSIVALANPRRSLVSNSDGSSVANATYGTAAADTQGMFGPVDGGWGELSDRVIEICNEGDQWCSADSRIAPLSGLFEELSLDPADTKKTARAVREVLQDEESYCPETREGLAVFLKFLLSGTEVHLAYDTSVDGMRPGTDIATEWVLQRAEAAGVTLSGATTTDSTTTDSSSDVPAAGGTASSL
ncbi:cutinase family protein [Corynebacterium sp. H113]|uniref:cutinase family protein n=1 Tax=Corynebacterium sp. H113 TaxID=3133419 RepID=UPI0030AA5C72